MASPGVPNNLNVRIANCPAQAVPCPPGIGPGPGALLTAAVTVAAINFGAIPIANPVREQGAFLLANGKIGVPIPLEALDAAGAVIPGLTVGANGAGAGPFVSGVTVTSNDTTTHTALFLVDATNGAIAQAAASNAAGTTASTVTTTITPQSAIYSAGGTGYADVAAPTVPAGLIAVGASNYFTDGNAVKIDGTAPTGVTTAGTTLGALTSATWPNATAFIYAVDNAQAGGSTAAESGSGLYAYNLALSTEVPVSAQASANNYIQFPNPVAVAQAPGTIGATHPYLFVVDKNGGIYRVDISGASQVAPVGGFQEATNVLPTIAVTGTPLNPGTAKVLGTATLAGGQFLIGDPGNNRIAQVDATQSPAVITSWASGAPFTGVYLSGTSAYATSTTGPDLLHLRCRRNAGFARIRDRYRRRWSVRADRIADADVDSDVDAGELPAAVPERQLLRCGARLRRVRTVRGARCSIYGGTVPGWKGICSHSRCRRRIARRHECRRNDRSRCDQSNRRHRGGSDHCGCECGCHAG